MFARILSSLSGRAGITHKSVKHPDPDIRLFENDRAAQAYLQMRPTRSPPSADFGIDTRACLQLSSMIAEAS
jgi:hypothetical protein